MADEIRADYTQLQQVATQFSRQATAINRMQQQMKHSLGGLQGNWIGHGSEAFFSGMRDKVLPATQRLADALRAAQKVTLQISQALQAAEEDAARPFRSHGGAAHPAPTALNQLPVSNTALPPPPEALLHQQLLEQIQQALERRGVARTATQADQDNYSVADLPLALLSVADLRRLTTYLGLKPGVPPRLRTQPQLTVEDALQRIAVLQRYWGYDNAHMVSALREIYYPTALNNFIKDASAVNATILDLDRPGATATERSAAALALTLLHLSRQRPGYVEPLLLINRAGQEVGFDHVIAGLDGYFHWTTEVQGAFPQKALAILDVHTINSLHAVTWQGDLAASGQQAYNKLTDWLLSRFPNVAACGEISDAVAAGYCVEMPPEDREGDVMAGALIYAQHHLKFTETNHDLANVMRTAYNMNGVFYTQRYRLFAESLGLNPDPLTGVLDLLACETFIERNIMPISAFSQGLISLESKNPMEAICIYNKTDTWARFHLTYFLDEIQAQIPKTN